MISKTLKRIPVIYKDKVLMPMKWVRANKLLKSNKARLIKSKLGFYVLELKYIPSGYNTQEVSLGIDPGTIFDSYSIVTRDLNVHFQLSFQTNRAKSNKIINRSNHRRDNRKCRRSKRSRRHQKIRFNFRNSHKYSNTINSKLMRTKWIISLLIKYFPISKIVVEEVSFNHYINNLGRSYSNVEIGKSELRRFIINDLKLLYINSKSYITTRELRLKYFNNKDPKLQDKGEKSFYAHSIDSYVIALDSLNISELSKLKSRYRYLNKHVIFINQVDWINRRQLDRFRCLFGNKCRYFRYSLKGKVRYFEHYPKLKKIRVKVDNFTNSNHISNWRYAYQNVDINRDKFISDRNLEVYSYTKPTYKHFKSRYGGSIVIGNSGVNLPRGISKYSIYDWINRKVVGYRHFNLQII